MHRKTNDQIILSKIVEEKRAESGDAYTAPEFFEIYTASQILKDNDLTYDDISNGIVGNAGDGGVDSMYAFVNGELIKEVAQINSSQKKNHIELIIIQSKASSSFKEDAIVKFKETAEDLFNLAGDSVAHAARYNSELIEKCKLFREVYSKLAGSFPKLEIRFFYATQGDEVHPNVEGKVLKLKEVVSKMFSGSEFSFEFVGASRLLEMIRSVPSTSRVLNVSDTPISTDSGSYVCLVSLSKYYAFVSDSGVLARSIFESNVRDYQGSVAVNTAIRKTLENKDSENFWYLNNGVTIITPKAVLAGKQLTIEDPQIVNGLQTSHEIYSHFSELRDSTGDERSVLVRVICVENEVARDRIIKATNSQTSIPPASLRSSDEIHRNIEDFLKINGFFYDRKKNFYKNQGMPVAKIISIPYMAQAMLATILLKPDSARARPSTLINSDQDYQKIFSLDYPIDIYLKVIQIVKAVEGYLRPGVCFKELERKTITNIKYYFAMLVSIRLANKKNDMAAGISILPSVHITNELLKELLQKALLEFDLLGATDQVAKGTELVSNLLK